jgi:hypothetical protein
VIDGKTVFVIEKKSMFRMLRFWIQWYIKAPFRDFLLRSENRRIANGKYPTLFCYRWAVFNIRLQKKKWLKR